MRLSRHSPVGWHNGHQIQQIVFSVLGTDVQAHCCQPSSWHSCLISVWCQLMFSKSDGTIYVRLHSSWQQRATRLLEPSSPRYRLFPGDHQLERRGRRNQICNHPIIGTQYSACLQARRGCDPPVARCCGKSCSKGPVLAKYGHSSIHVRREQIGGPVFIHHA